MGSDKHDAQVSGVRWQKGRKPEIRARRTRARKLCMGFVRWGVELARRALSHSKKFCNASLSRPKKEFATRLCRDRKRICNAFWLHIVSSEGVKIVWFLCYEVKHVISAYFRNFASQTLGACGHHAISLRILSNVKFVTDPYSKISVLRTNPIMFLSSARASE